MVRVQDSYHIAPRSNSYFLSAPQSEPEGEDAFEEETAAEVKARALFDYDAANDAELSFKAGDILIVTEQDDSGWYVCVAV